MRLVLALAVSLYCGNALKDLACAPRPLAMMMMRKGKEKTAAATPTTTQQKSSSSSSNEKTPEIRLLTADSSGASERKSLLEYGFPSSHVMNSLVLSLHAVQCCRSRFFFDSEGSSSPSSGLGSSTFFLSAARLAAVLWTLLVALARVACGMHTPVDVVGGLVAGLLVVAALALEDFGGGEGDRGLSLDARYVGWLSAGGPPAALLHSLASALLLRLHPLPKQYTTSFEATTAFAGACAGVALGVSLGGGGGGGGGSDHHHHHHLPFSSPLFFALRRLALGFTLVALVKELSKRLVLALVPLPYRACPLRLRRLWQPPVPSLKRNEKRMERLGIPVDSSGRPWDEILTAKFVSYAALGWAVAWVAPVGFAAAGI